MILFGCDHAGFQLKEVLLAHLATKNIATHDFGCYTEESIDYPDFAHPVAIAVSKNTEALGVLICGSGNGINMTANKHSGIRSAICWKKEIAVLARQHNNANILALPARFLTNEEGIEILTAFLETHFEGGRHQNRIDKIPQ
ncbi:MAG: ribose 5-phosphate isomerase B [Flavobacteriia bacterium]|nr:ribose 5-phosphate isomerase B [Flavobacteriia bacterium]